MIKQRKHMLLLAVAFVLILGLFFLADRVPEQEKQEEAVTYEVTNLNSEEIMELIYTNEDGTFSFQRAGEDWIYPEDTQLDIDETKINTLVKKIATYASKNKIANVTDLSVYGLSKPGKVITMSDGLSSFTMNIGDYNSVTATYYMYLSEDPSVVYTVTASDVSSYGYTLEDVIIEPETESEG